MRLIEKALLGLTAIGTAGAMGTAAFQGMASEEKSLIDAQVNKFKATSGYIASNYEYKSKQITKLMQDYSLGLLSDDKLVERIKEENLTELDFDSYAKNNLAEKEYQKYLKLKEQKAENDEQLRILPSYMIASFTLAGMSVAAFTCKEIDERRKHKQEAETLINN